MSEHPFFAKPTKVKILTGHLTATNKRVILHMLDNKMADAKTPKITYHITPQGDEYKVVTEQTETDGYGRKFVNKYSATFSVS